MIRAGTITAMFGWTVVHAGYFVPDFPESGSRRRRPSRSRTAARRRPGLLTGRFFLEYDRDVVDPPSSGRLVLDFDENKAQRPWMYSYSQNDDREQRANHPSSRWWHEERVEPLWHEDDQLEPAKQTKFLRLRKNDGLLGSPGPVPGPQEQRRRPPLLESIDWVARGAVTEAVDMGNCGGCWAMSLVGYIEGKLFNVLAENGRGTLVKLSSQFLLDCSFNKGHLQGCYGGNLREAIMFVKQYGLCEEQQYPFVCKDMQKLHCMNSKCNWNCAKVLRPGLIDSLQSLKPTSLSLKMALMYGPSMAVIDGSSPELQHWVGSRVIPPRVCEGYDNPNHGVLVVGYGFSQIDGKYYWKIKNVWGRSWAEDGFGYLERGEPGVNDELSTCGILQLVLITKWSPAFRSTPAHMQQTG